MVYLPKIIVYLLKESLAFAVVFIKRTIIGTEKENDKQQLLFSWRV